MNLSACTMSLIVLRRALAWSEIWKGQSFGTANQLNWVIVTLKTLLDTCMKKDWAWHETSNSPSFGIACLQNKGILGQCVILGFAFKMVLDVKRMKRVAQIGMPVLQSKVTLELNTILDMPTRFVVLNIG
jgi:hypothetical protein